MTTSSRPYGRWPCPACHSSVLRTPTGLVRKHRGRLDEDRGDSFCPGSGFDPDAPALPQLQARGLAA